MSVENIQEGAEQPVEMPTQQPFYQEQPQPAPEQPYQAQQPYQAAPQPDQPYQQAYQQQQPYQQPYQPQPRVFPQSGTNRALAMSVYWGLLPLIFALVVCDKSDPFIRHHLNQALVLFIGSIIAMVTAFFIIGGILAIVILVFTIMATIDAYNGIIKPLPLIGSIEIVK